MKKLLLALTLAIGLWTLDARAATYYVSKTASGAHASDGTNCSTTDSAATNKLTIRWGLACVAAGDTLYIHTGTYVETITPSGGSGYHVPFGTDSTHVITIAGFTGETATLRGIALQDNVDATIIKWLVFDHLTVDAGGNPASIVSTGNPVYLSGGTHDIVVQNCNLWNANQVIVYANDTTSNITIKNNLIHDAYVSLFGTAHPTTANYGFYWRSHNGLIEGNTIYNNAGYAVHMYGSGLTTVSNNVVRNNIMYGNAYSDGERNLGLGAIIMSSGTNNLAYNNVIYSNGRTGGSSTSSAFALGVGSSGTNTCPSCKAYNNTIYGNTGVGFADRTNNSDIRNNIVYNNTVGQFTFDFSGSTTSNNLCGSAGTGCSVIGNPLVVDAATNDYHLQSGSPAKDAGTSLSTVFTTDKDGITRPFGSAWDIGAYEFNTPDTTAPVISSVLVSSLIDVSATITWTTDEASKSQVEYGLTSSYGTSTTLDSNLVTSHSVNLSGLTASTLYHFRARSADSAGNTGLSSDVTFTTAPTPFTSTIVWQYPIGGEHFVSGVSYNILWISDDPGNLKIEYGYDNGTSFPVSVTASVAASAGTFAWTPSSPALATPIGKLKITSLTTPGLFAVTNGVSVSGQYVK